MSSSTNTKGHCGCHLLLAEGLCALTKRSDLTVKDLWQRGKSVAFGNAIILASVNRMWIIRFWGSAQGDRAFPAVT